MLRFTDDHGSNPIPSMAVYRNRCYTIHGIPYRVIGIDPSPFSGHKNSTFIRIDGLYRVFLGKIPYSSIQGGKCTVSPKKGYLPVQGKGPDQALFVLEHLFHFIGGGSPLKNTVLGNKFKIITVIPG